MICEMIHVFIQYKHRDKLKIKTRKERNKLINTFLRENRIATGILTVLRVYLGWSNNRPR